MNSLSYETLQATLDLIPAHAWYANHSGVLSLVNERFADYVGLAMNHSRRVSTDTDAPWDAIVNLIHPEDSDRARQTWSRCMESGVAGEMIVRVRRADGGYRWFLSRGEPHFDEDGVLRGWIGINIDIEQQRLTEFYLAEGQRLGRAGSWALTPDGFEFWSSGLFQLHGLDPDSKVPSIEEYLALVHPEDRDYVAQEIARIKAKPAPFDFTKRIAWMNGEVRYIRCVGVPATGGTFRGFLGTGIDVTEQEQSANALRKSEQEFRQIVDLAPHLVAVLGPNFERIYANRQVLDYLGYGLDAWLHSEIGAQAHPDDRGRLAAFSSSLPIDRASDIELRIPKGDGGHRWFLARYNPVCGEQGQLLRWYVACTDIDERKKAEERLQHENIALREEIEKTSMFEEIIGGSPPLIGVLSRVAKVAASDSTVLITGETGTGKELVARAIHRRSRRSSRAFVAVNCAAIPHELFASELFGHEKGAFTGATHRRLGRFELADGGTIFLDEVGELWPDTQAALLRLLQEQEFERVGGSDTVRVDARVIAATNCDLEAAVAEGTFRQDLFYRLQVFPVEMPPLRERGDDIPLLVRYFIDRYAQKMGKAFRRVNNRTVSQLRAYPWPGNVRELQNVIERSVIVCESEEFVIDDSWLLARPLRDRKLAMSTSLAAQERMLIEDALRHCGGRVFGPNGAATLLGIPRSTLESKIRALKIDKGRFRQRSAD